MPELLHTLFAPTSDDLAFVLRILLAGFLAAVIGWQRQRRGSPAGLRTHAMIAVAAAAFTSIAVDRFPADTGRVMQGILTGVGFLGSGIIWRASGGVRGLTTAAGIWAVTAVGIMVGTGEYFMGISLFLMILLVLALPAREHAAMEAVEATTQDTDSAAPRSTKREWSEK